MYLPSFAMNRLAVVILAMLVPPHLRINQIINFRKFTIAFHTNLVVCYEDINYFMFYAIFKILLWLILDGT